MQAHLEKREATEKLLHTWEHVIRYHSENTRAINIIACAIRVLREEAALYKEIEDVRRLPVARKNQGILAPVE